jgi:hypothetical protein
MDTPPKPVDGKVAAGCHQGLELSYNHSSKDQNVIPTGNGFRRNLSGGNQVTEKNSGQQSITQDGAVLSGIVLCKVQKGLSEF